MDCQCVCCPESGSSWWRPRNEPKDGTGGAGPVEDTRPCLFALSPALCPFPVGPFWGFWLLPTFPGSARLTVAIKVLSPPPPPFAWTSIPSHQPPFPEQGKTSYSIQSQRSLLCETRRLAEASMVHVNQAPNGLTCHTFRILLHTSSLYPRGFSSHFETRTLNISGGEYPRNHWLTCFKLESSRTAFLNQSERAVPMVRTVLPCSVYSSLPSHSDTLPHLTSSPLPDSQSSQISVSM